MYAEDREGNLKALWPLNSVIAISFLIRDFIYYPGITCHPNEDNDSRVVHLYFLLTKNRLLSVLCLFRMSFIFL